MPAEVINTNAELAHNSKFIRMHFNFSLLTG